MKFKQIDLKRSPRDAPHQPRGLQLALSSAQSSAVKNTSFFPYVYAGLYYRYKGNCIYMLLTQLLTFQKMAKIAGNS